MPDKPNEKKGKPVPTSRLSRLAGLGSMAANVAGGMMLSSARQLAAGKRPRLNDLLLTPANALKITHKLANMRGAAMKIGQMISMDSGNFLPKELAEILAQLRKDAQHMPRTQLNKVLNSEWGNDWNSQFSKFDYRPIAAASIGQVQSAQLESGETLAIKVQYPGVIESIDSDVNNVASLLRMTGLVPASLDVTPVIEEGRKQLHQEADYIREAAYLSRFGELLSDDDNFEVPKFYPEYSTERILAMSHIRSIPIEAMIDASQETRNRLVTLLIDLLLRELFVFKVMQTDPNFANYRYNEETGQLVLLDFGASRDIEKHTALAYANMMKAIISGDNEVSFQAATDMGLIAKKLPAEYRAEIIGLLDLAIEPMQHDEDFDFGDNQVGMHIQEKGMQLAAQRELWHVPPAEMVFVQRKLGGMLMLATRLRAKVNVHALIKNYVDDAR